MERLLVLADKDTRGSSAAAPADGADAAPSALQEARLAELQAANTELKQQVEQLADQLRCRYSK